jgi:Flp pilus assembly protein TadG
LVEFALVLPVFLLLLLVMFEFGFAYNHSLTVGLATREGARTGAALANGGATSCSGGNDPNKIDAQIVAGVQRILKSPGSDVEMSDVQSVRIYKADSSGNQIGSYVDVWAYTGSGSGPDVIPGNGTERIDFTQSSTGWPVCSRDNGSNPDALGVQVRYRYRLKTPLASLVGFLQGNQTTTIQMNDQTVMNLDPTTS